MDGIHTQRPRGQPTTETMSCVPFVFLKGKSSRKLMMEFKHIQKGYWGRHLWARGYFVASGGNVTDEAMMQYIRGQDGTEPNDGDENFQVTPS